MDSSLHLTGSLSRISAELQLQPKRNQGHTSDCIRKAGADSRQPQNSERHKIIRDNSPPNPILIIAALRVEVGTIRMSLTYGILHEFSYTHVPTFWASLYIQSRIKSNCGSR